MSTVGGRLSRREQMRVERLRCGGREFRGGVEDLGEIRFLSVCLLLQA